MLNFFNHPTPWPSNAPQTDTVLPRQLVLKSILNISPIPIQYSPSAITTRVSCHPLVRPVDFKYPFRPFYICIAYPILGSDPKMVLANLISVNRVPQSPIDAAFRIYQYSVPILPQNTEEPCTHPHNIQKQHC